MNTLKKNRLLLSLLAALASVTLPTSNSFAEESINSLANQLEAGGVINKSVVNHNAVKVIISDITISDLEAVGVQKGLGINNYSTRNSKASLTIVGKLNFKNRANVHNF